MMKYNRVFNEISTSFGDQLIFVYKNNSFNKFIGVVMDLIDERYITFDEYFKILGICHGINGGEYN